MYFSSRVEAGKQLAERLKNYNGTDCAIVALSDGAVIIAAQIAAKLQCVITMLLLEPIKVPGEPDPVASIDQEGGLTYNKAYSSGEIEEFNMEYRGSIEASKITNLRKMHRVVAKADLIRKDLLRDKNVIIVADGLKTSFSMDAVGEYLKPLKIKRLIVATPFASIAAVDSMHLLADEIQCLNVIDNYFDTDHYYENNRKPEHSTVIKSIQNIVKHWN